jgi:hypothetical protein
MKPDDIPQIYELCVVRDVVWRRGKAQRDYIPIYTSSECAEVEREAGTIKDDAWVIRLITVVAASEMEPRRSK